MEKKAARPLTGGFYKEMPSSLKFKAVVAICILAPLACVLLSLCIGRYPVPLDQVVAIVFDWLFHPLHRNGDIPYTVVIDIRFPRAVVGALVGGALAVSGTAFQGLFKNPLVSSGILGVSSGAGFGAALAILLFNTVSATYPLALCFGVLAVFMSYAIGSIYRRTPTIMLVLGGVIVSSVFSALISLVKYVADPYEQLPAIVFWLMGSLASAQITDIAIAAPPIVLGVVGLWCVRFRLNVLSMGDKEARTMAGHMGLTRGLVIVCATLATAGAVSVAGVIGWIGLIIPHIGRMIVGNDNRILIPVSFSLGASFLILIDIISRMLTGSEIPIGILTAICGAPFFVYLLKKTKGRGVVGTTMINIQNITFGYNGKPVFTDIRFSMERGEIFCLLGPNGCGKTTLLDCILGLLTPEKGKIMVQGKDISSCSSGHIPRSMAYVPQNHESTFPYTVTDMVLMGRAAHIPFFSTPGPEDLQVARQALEQVGMTDMSERPYTMLSGGERQLVIIARALAQKTPVIVMDEPTAHLDFRHEFIVLETIMNLVRSQNLAVVMATHFPNHAFYFESRQIPTRVALLHQGHFLSIGRPREVLTPDSIRTLYGIDSNIVSFDNNGSSQSHVIPVKGETV